MLYFYDLAEIFKKFTKTPKLQVVQRSEMIFSPYSIDLDNPLMTFKSNVNPVNAARDC